LPTILKQSAISTQSGTQQATQQPSVQVMPGALEPPGAPTFVSPSPGQTGQPIDLEPLIPEAGFGGGC